MKNSLAFSSDFAEVPDMQATDHKFATMADAKAFAVAGNAIITLQSLRSGAHFTYKVQLPKDADDSKPVPYFVKVLTSGCADGGDWVYLGMIREGVFQLTKASRRFTETPSFKAFSFFWLSEELHPELVVRHEGHCGRCGRTLTHPESIDLGIGPECATKLAI
jgi:hypothetical protein